MLGVQTPSAENKPFFSHLIEVMQTITLLLQSDCLHNFNTTAPDGGMARFSSLLSPQSE